MRRTPSRKNRKCLQFGRAGVRPLTRRIKLKPPCVIQTIPTHRSQPFIALLTAQTVTRLCISDPRGLTLGFRCLIVSISSEISCWISRSHGHLSAHLGREVAQSGPTHHYHHRCEWIARIEAAMVREQIRRLPFAMSAPNWAQMLAVTTLPRVIQTIHTTAQIHPPCAAGAYSNSHLDFPFLWLPTVPLRMPSVGRRKKLGRQERRVRFIPFPPLM
jgi:hypothetical protein